MGKYTHLMIHCSASKNGADITPDMIKVMHMGCKVNGDGSVYYRGKLYGSKSELPDESLGGVPANETRGRGWSRVGYSKFIDIHGEVHTLQDYDDDLWISSKEYTNGAKGMNMVTRHFCYAGGLTAQKINGKLRAFVTLNEAQEKSLLTEIRAEVDNNPDVLICGHNQYANKGCPSFLTQIWLKAHGFDEKNIDPKRFMSSLMPVFKNKQSGDHFRVFVNDNFPKVAREIDLDRTGSYTNDYILNAYYRLRHDYSKEVGSLEHLLY